MCAFDPERDMSTNSTRFTLLLTLALLLSALAPSVPALDSSGLLGMLTGQLGVSEQQASGGINALMDVVKQNLPGGDYSQLIGGAPDLGALAKADAPAPAAPQGSSGWGGLLGSAGSLLGGQHQALGQAAQLTQSFSQLGLSTDMVGKFAKVAMDYVQGSGGTGLMKLLAKALPF